MDESKPYRKMPDAENPAASWVFDGIEGDIIGDEGLGIGGAAGIEFDRYDLALGTPPHTLILASSEGHSDNFPLVVEDILCAYPGVGGTQDHRIRADMTYFTTPNEGAVWSASSIAWGQALPINACDNSASKVTANVLNAFMKDRARCRVVGRRARATGPQKWSAHRRPGIEGRARSAPLHELRYE